MVGLKSFLVGALAGSTHAMSHDAEPITYSGCIIDWACWNRTLDGQNAPDQSNIISDPTPHYKGCLLLGGEGVPGGFYLAQTCGGSNNYHPKFDLRDPVTHANAVDYIMGLPDEPRSDNVKVTAEGLNDHSRLINATFSSCSGDSCDGVCNATGHACEGLAESHCK